MSTHPSLPTCSPEPRALWSALSLPPSLPPTHGRATSSLPLSPVEWAVGDSQKEEEGSSPKCRPTEHSSPGGWEVAQAKVPDLEKRRGEGGPRGRGAAGLKSFKGKRRSTNRPLPGAPTKCHSSRHPRSSACLPRVWVSALSGSREGRGQRLERAQKTDGDTVLRGWRLWEKLTHTPLRPPAQVQQHLDCS